MTWFLKTFVFCATILLVGFILEVYGYTMVMCQDDCIDEPDDHLCGRKMYDIDGKQVADYEWLRNECERKCLLEGEFERVKMDECTKHGHNYTTYKCSDSKGHPGLFQKCMRNESNH